MVSHNGQTDLHDLTKNHGTDTVAKVLGVSPRALADIRRGKSPMTVDDLYELERAYPQFDVLGTIRRIGAVRETRGWSRKGRL
jgi:transcriptional regulator with XRE-family HTH domain